MLEAPAEVEALTEQLALARQVSPDSLRASHAATFETELGYDPLTATNLELVLPLSRAMRGWALRRVMRDERGWRTARRSSASQVGSVRRRLRGRARTYGACPTA